MKGVMRFGKKGKIIPRYVVPYKILKRVGKVAYELDLPTELAAVYSVFHILNLKKCVGDPTSIVSLESVEVKDSISYEDVPVEILDHRVRRLKNKRSCLSKGFVEESVRKGSYLENRSETKKPSILTSILPIPLQLEV